MNTPATLTLFIALFFNILLQTNQAVLSAELTETYPAGTFGATETLRSPRLQGWKSSGNGTCSPSDASPWLNSISKTATKIIVEKQFEGPLIHAQGAHWKLQDMCLLGWQSYAHHKANIHSRPHKTAIHIADHDSRYNGAKATLSNLSIGGFETAIDLSTKGKLGNDNLNINDVYIAHCGSGLKIAANQAVATRGRNWFLRSVDQVVLGEGGADVTISGMDISDNTTLLHVTGSGHFIGPNNGWYRFNQIKADNSGPNATLTLVRAGHSNAHFTVVIEDLRLSVPNNKQLVAYLTGKNQRLDIDRAYNLPKRITLDPGPGRITICNSDLPIDPQEMLPETATGTLHVINCFYKGELITKTYRN